MRGKFAPFVLTASLVILLDQITKASYNGNWKQSRKDEWTSAQARSGRIKSGLGIGVGMNSPPSSAIPFTSALSRFTGPWPRVLKNSMFNPRALRPATTAD